MSKIIKVDTNGVKPLLDMRELGYDNYPAGGDVGRVYVGTGTANIALAKKSEVDGVINGSVLVDGRDVSLDGAKLDTIASGAQVNDVNTTVQGNTFNGNSQLVQTTVDGKLPALDGRNLTNVVSAGSVDLTTAQTIAGVKTFTSNPLSSASQSTNSNALTKYSAVVKNSGNETIAGVKTFSSSPLVPTPTTGSQVANKDYVDNNIEIITAGTGLQKVGTTLNFYPFGLTTASTELTTSDFVVVSESTTPKKITIANFANELPLLGVGQTWQDVTASRSAGVTYTNTTGKPIMISMRRQSVTNSIAHYLYVNGIIVSTGTTSTGYTQPHTLTTIVPNGSTYATNYMGTFWVELR